VPGGARGKAWELSPWGRRVFVAAISGPLADRVPEAELAEGAHAMLRKPGPALLTIPNDEVYRRLDSALSLPSDKPLQLTTLIEGDVREHERSWQLLERVFMEGRIERPVEWILLDTDATQGLIEEAEGNDRVSVWSIEQGEIDRIDDAVTVQVLDSEGLVYPVPPRGVGLVGDRADALEKWTQMSSAGHPVLLRGARQRVKVGA
jgi:hypothetical protein